MREKNRRYRYAQRGGACLVARRQGQGRQRWRRAPELRRYRELRRCRDLPREKRGRKQYKYTANTSNTMHNMVIRGDIGDLTQCRVILVKGNNNRKSIPDVCRFRTEGPEGNGCMFVMLGMRDGRTDRVFGFISSF